MVIYKLTCIKTGKCYIGQTKNYKRRFREYKCECKHKDNYLFYKDMRKYGFENFKFKIIREYPNRTELHKEEKYWIKKLNSKYPNGYNISIGGNSWAWKNPIATAKKISDTRKSLHIINSELQRQTVSKLVTGENNPKAKITDKIVKKIRNEYDETTTQKKIAKKYNLTQATISKIILKQTWKHVK